MNNFSTLIFPDSSFLDEVFIKSCLIYFDKIIVPIGKDFDEAEIIRLGDMKVINNSTNFKYK